MTIISNHDPRTGDAPPAGSAAKLTPEQRAARDAEARALYRLSLDEAKPLSAKALGEMYGCGETWGRARRDEVRAEAALAAAEPAPDAEETEAETAELTETLVEETAPDTEEPAPVSDTPVVEDPPAAESAADEEPSAPRKKNKKKRKKAKQEGAETAPPKRGTATWPVLLLLLPATVAIWSGWVGLGEYAGFGPVQLLPGMGDGLVINTAITLPIGMEAYSAYALYVWLSGKAPKQAHKFARASAIIALAVGSLGQVAYHVLKSAGLDTAPVWVVAGVACLPVAVVGLGAALAHMVRAGAHPPTATSAERTKTTTPNPA